jgi:hypothetical protein
MTDDGRAEPAAAKPAIHRTRRLRNQARRRVFDVGLFTVAEIARAQLRLLRNGEIIGCANHVGVNRPHRASVATAKPLQRRWRNLCGCHRSSSGRFNFGTDVHQSRLESDQIGSKLSTWRSGPVSKVSRQGKAASERATECRGGLHDPRAVQRKPGDASEAAATVGVIAPVDPPGELVRLSSC